MGVSVSVKMSRQIEQDIGALSTVCVIVQILRVTVTDNLFEHDLQKSPALPPSCLDYYADLSEVGGPL